MLMETMLTRSHQELSMAIASSPARRKMSSLNASLLSDAPIAAFRAGVLTGQVESWRGVEGGGGMHRNLLCYEQSHGEYADSLSSLTSKQADLLRIGRVWYDQEQKMMSKQATHHIRTAYAPASLT